MAGCTPTSRSSLVNRSTEQPTPQYGQMVRVFSTSPGVAAARSAVKESYAVLSDARRLKAYQPGTCTGQSPDNDFQPVAHNVMSSFVFH